MIIKAILFLLKREQIKLSKKVSTTQDKIALLNKARAIQNIVVKVRELK